MHGVRGREDARQKERAAVLTAGHSSADSRAQQGKHCLRPLVLGSPLKAGWFLQLLALLT